MVGLIPSIANSVLVNILNKIYEEFVVIKLTERENYRTVTELEDSLIAKMFMFSFINFSNSLIFIAIIKGYMEDTFGECVTANPVYSHNMRCYGE